MEMISYCENFASIGFNLNENNECVITFYEGSDTALNYIGSGIMPEKDIIEIFSYILKSIENGRKKG